MKDLEGLEHCRVTSANYNGLAVLPHIKQEVYDERYSKAFRVDVPESLSILRTGAGA